MNTTPAQRSSDPYIDSLLNFDIWDGLTITFSFPDAVSDYDDYDPEDSDILASFSSFTDMQKDAARYILSMISSFTNLVFVELTGAEDADATLRFGRTTLTDTAFAFLPSDDPIGGDTWVSRGSDLNSPEVGNYAYFVLMHEIGHALGLLHPHEAEAAVPMPADRDWMAYTVMSYRSYENASVDGYTNGHNDFAQTFMMEDMAALQFAYGTNYNHNSDDTLYFVDVNTGELYVNGVTEPKPADNTVFRTIWDGGGVDLLDFANFTGAHTGGMLIDLAPGGFTQVSHLQRADLGDGFRAPGEIALAHLVNGDLRSIIENARGSTEGDVIKGNQVANRLDGYQGDDEIYGFGGDDHLIGGEGSDKLYGGDGDDILESWAGLNRMYGEDGNDTITGGFQADQLFGGAGNDIIDGGTAADLIYGGEGDDRIFGGDMRDELFGDEGDDHIEGGDGSDIIDGGTGADYMAGGSGDDKYTIDDAGDVIFELSGGGSDRVVSSIDLILPEHFENATLTESDARMLTGNSVDNTLGGNAQDNIINGGAGADRMEGHAGNDTYYVDNAGDTIREAPGDSLDIVYASISFELPREFTERCVTCASLKFKTIAPADIEFLFLTGTDDINATGNEIANTITGNSGANILTGAEGDDTLDGGEGIDTAVFSGNFADYSINAISGTTIIVTGTDGIDTLTAIEFAQFADQTVELVYVDPLATTTGDDLITLTSASSGGDITQIDGQSGSDTLDASGIFSGSVAMQFRTYDVDADFVGYGTIQAANYELVNFEIVYGSDIGANWFFTPHHDRALTLFGGQYDDRFFGNFDFADTFHGLDGNDLFTVAAGDSAFGGEGNDTFSLYIVQAGAAAASIDGGAGIDLLEAEFGAVVDLAAETASRAGGTVSSVTGVENVEVYAWQSYATSVSGDGLANRLYVNPTFNDGSVGVYFDGRGGDDDLSGSAGDDTLIGGTGHDLLNGGLGDDDLRGGLGDDTFYIDSLSDSVTELADQGADTVLASFKLFIAQSNFANVEAFGLTGAAFQLFGDDSGNELHANADLASKLFGFAGADMLTGGIGNDKLYGGDDNDVIIGGAGNDRVDGGRGADDMRGGIGNDNYFVDDLGDTVTELASEGIDIVKSLFNWTLGANVENLRLRGTADDGTGNELDNTLQAVASNSTLRGMDGDDNLRGSNGTDLLFGNNGNDTINGRSGDDDIRGGSGDDDLLGRSGEDTLRGGSGNDELNGGKDDDFLHGGADQDILTGEAGADTFYFAGGDFAGLTLETADRITDFDAGEGDLIDLSGLDAILGGADDAFNFIGDAAFTNTAGELRFEQDGDNTMIYMDVDGDGAADHAIRLDGNLSLLEASFIL